MTKIIFLGQILISRHYRQVNRTSTILHQGLHFTQFGITTLLLQHNSKNIFTVSVGNFFGQICSKDTSEGLIEQAKYSTRGSNSISLILLFYFICRTFKRYSQSSIYEKDIIFRIHSQFKTLQPAYRTSIMLHQHSLSVLFYFSCRSLRDTVRFSYMTKILFLDQTPSWRHE